MIEHNGIILPDFDWDEGYSTIEIAGFRKFKVVPIPDELKDNAFRVFENLQLIRSHFDKPVIITKTGCMYRTPEYNRVCGGSKKSKHLTAEAADIKVSLTRPEKIYKWAREHTEFKGFGLGINFIHLDLRNTYTLWYY